MQTVGRNIITNPRDGKVQQGEAFTYRVDLNGVEALYPNGFGDAYLYAVIMNSPQRNKTLFTTEVLHLPRGTVMADFTIGGDITGTKELINGELKNTWIAGNQVAMQFLLVVENNPKQYDVSDMIYIRVKEGRINPIEMTPQGQGSFNRAYSAAEYHVGSEGGQ